MGALEDFLAQLAPGPTRGPPGQRASMAGTPPPRVDPGERFSAELYQKMGEGPPPGPPPRPMPPMHQGGAGLPGRSAPPPALPFHPRNAGLRNAGYPPVAPQQSIAQHLMGMLTK